MELKFPVDEDGPFPSSSSITERFLPPGLKSAFIAFSNLTLIYFWPILNWDNFNQLSTTSVDGSLMEQKGWWCRFSFFLDNVGHLWPDTMTTVMWDKQSPFNFVQGPLEVLAEKMIFYDGGNVGDIVEDLLHLLLFPPALKPANVSTHLMTTVNLKFRL